MHQGVEAGLGVAFLKSIFAQEDRFWFNLAYTYSDFCFDGDARWGNNRLPGVPPHYLRAEVLYKHPNGFYAGPNVEWMPQAFFADNANSLTVDPYALLNFKIGYDTGHRLVRLPRRAQPVRQALHLDHDHRRNRHPHIGALQPGHGRAIYGGVRYRM